VYFGLFNLKYVKADAHAEQCIVDLTPLFDGEEEGGVLWPELNFLSKQAEGLESNEIFQIDNNTPGAEKVLIEVIANENADTTVLKNELANLGFVRFPEGTNPRIFTGLLPIANLQAFNNDPLTALTKFVRPMYTPLSEATEKSGIVGTQQDRALRSDLVRKAFNEDGSVGIDGSGVTLGIISDSYANSLAAVSSAESSGDLPMRGTAPDSPMQVLSDWTGSFGLFGGTDEGNAMTQIAFDIAPGAKFRFATGALSAERMAFEYRRLAEEGCDIVIDDILHLGEPFAPKGQIAKAVEDVIASGVHVMSSAGNYRDHSILENFINAPIPASFDDFDNSTTFAHDWGNGQILKEVELSPGVFVLEMQWLDDFYAQGEGSGAAYNMDIWIVTGTGQKVYSGNRNNIGEDPIEIEAFVVENPITLNLMITGENIPENLPFQLIILRAPSNPFGWQFTEGNENVFSGTTILGHSAVPENNAVGAAFFGFTPAYDYQPDRLLEPFSSYGGPILGGGSATPSYTAPDAGNNTFFGTDLPSEFDAIDNDEFPNFAGTSAAVPAAAAVNALILQAYKEFYNMDKIAPAALKALVQSTSLDFGDPNSGAGLMQADKTLLSLANPAPDLKELIFPEDYDFSTAGNEPFTIKAQIFYPILTYDENGELVLVDGEPVPLLENNGTTFSLRESELDLQPYEDGSLYQWIDLEEYILEVNLAIPEFIGNPSFTITNAAKAEGDGGSFTVENILDKPLTEILVKANDANKLFGEDIPSGDFSFDIYIKNEDTSDPNDWILATENPLTTVEISALSDAIQLNTPASFQSLVGAYSIKNEIINQNIIDNLSESYILNGLGEDNIGWGVLTIDRLPVSYQAANPTDGNDFVESIYGEEIPFEMVYDFMTGDNPPNIAPENIAWVENFIRSSHQELLAPDNIFIIAEKGLALVEDENGNITEKGLALVEKGLALTEQQTYLITEKGLALAEKGLALTEKGLALVESQTAIEIGFEVAAPFLVDEEPVSPWINEKGLALVEGQEFLGLSIGDEYVIGEKGLALVEKGLALVEKGLALVEDADGNVTEEVNLHFVIEATDTELGENIRSINFVSGLDVLPLNDDGSENYHYIAPGALLNENLLATPKPVKLRITPREIDVLVDDEFPGEPHNFEKTFGEPDPEFTFTVSSDNPLVLGDDISVFGTTKLSRLTDENSENVGLYDILTNGLSAGDNYTIKSSLFNPDDEGAPKLKISPAILHVNAIDATKVFGEDDPIFDYDVTPDVDKDIFTGKLTRSDIDNENVGEYDILQGDLTAGTNYTILFTEAAFTITPLSLEVNALDATKVFGELDPEFDYTVTPEVDKDIFTGKLTRSDIDNENVGEYDILQGDLTAGTNYTILFAEAAFTITPLSLEVNALAATKVFGELDPEFDYTVTPEVDISIFTGKLTRSDIDNENVGEYEILQGDLTAGTNYTIWFAEAAFTITPLSLEVNALDATKVFGESDPEFDYTVTPEVDISIFTGKLTRSDIDNENVGEYDILQGDLTAGTNYTIWFAEAAFTITPLSLEVNALAATKVFGESDPEFDYTVTPEVDISIFTGKLTRSDIDNENVGEYDILQGDLTAGTNYTIWFAEAAFTITPLSLEVNALAATKVFGESDPEFDYTVTPEVDISIFTGKLTRSDIDNENVGEYDILQGDLTAGTNYTIGFTGNDFIITPLVLEVNAVEATKVFGDDDPEFDFTVVPEVDKNIFSGALTRSDIGVEDAGEYHILPGDLTAGPNYTIVFTGADFLITPLVLQVNAVDATKVYGEFDPVFEFTVTPEVDRSIFSNTLTRSDVGNENVGDYVIRQGDLTVEPNYAIEFTEAFFSITPAHLVVSAKTPRHPICEGDPLPDFEFYYFGFISRFNDNEHTVMFMPDENTSSTHPEYSGSRGIYRIIFNYKTQNYNITQKQTLFHPGLLFVRRHCDGSDDDEDDQSARKGVDNSRLTSSDQEGIAASLDEIQFRGYPNPTSDIYYVNLNSELVNRIKVSLVDMQGKMHDARFTRNVSRGRLELDLINLKTGLYLLKLDFDQDQKILKIMKR
jgi:hypothetical protein